LIAIDYSQRALPQSQPIKKSSNSSKKQHLEPASPLAKDVAMESADALVEEQKLMAEAKYRTYMTNIDKALRNFEYSSEWADLISALGKLSKV